MPPKLNICHCPLQFTEASFPPLSTPLSLLGPSRGERPASFPERQTPSQHTHALPSHSQHSAAAAPASRLGGPERSSGPWGLGSSRLTDLQARQFSEGSPCRLTPLVCRQFLAEPHTPHGSLRPQAAVRVIRAGVFRRSGRGVDKALGCHIRCYQGSGNNPFPKS